MTIWILYMALSPEEETAIATKHTLPLPFDALPDLSAVANQQQCRKLLASLYPEDPPEALTRRLEKIWKPYSELGLEDIIAVPLPHRQEVALAEVTGRYLYESDRHRIPVKWHGKRIPFRAFNKVREVLQPSDPDITEVADLQARVIIRDRLPHRYNRFAKVRWVLGIFIALSMLMMLARLLHT